MAYWLISVQSSSAQKDQLWNQLSRDVLQIGARSATQAFRFNTPQQFKIGSLDLLVSLADIMGKLDHHLESILRKIERQQLEIEAVKLTVDDPNPGVKESFDPESYMSLFQWNAAKYPPTKSLSDLISLIQQKMHELDDDLKQKLTKYQDAKNALSSISKRDTGNLYSKDLAEVFQPGVVSPSDFINTEHFVTAVAVVPIRDSQNWINSYEKLDDSVVPRSTKQFYADEREGLSLWRIVVLKVKFDDLVLRARERKWMLREFTYDPEYFVKQRGTREELEGRLTEESNKLTKLCKAAFSELYIALIHLKALRVYVESVLRYSLPPNFLSFVVKPEVGRESRLLDALIKRFLRAGETADLYSSKDDEESEEFFPFVMVRIGVPSV